jgi:hypothetical protein
MLAPVGAGAAEEAHLTSSFSPSTPGASTTITFGFTISNPEGGVPSPLSGVDLHLPAGIGLGRTNLGLAICDPYFLYEEGPNACPANSHIGYGTATAEIPYGPEIVQEQAEVFAYRGQQEGQSQTILFFAEGWYPVFADLVFPGQLLEDSNPFGGRINTNVPPIPSVPDGPNVSVVHVQSTFGPSHLTYYRRVHGKNVAFHPRGVTVPATCPAGGYPFAADFSFEDGNHLTAHTTVPCPHATTGGGARAQRRGRTRKAGG